MTISETEPLVAGPYNGNGVTTVFSYGMTVFAADELLVFLRDSLGVETQQTLTTNYTVAPTGGTFPATGGTITMLVAPPTGTQLIILPDVSRSQDRPFSSQSSITLQEVEDALDKLTAIARQLYERSLRAVTVSAFEPGDVETLIANVTALIALEDEIIALTANLAAIQNADTNMAAIIAAPAEAAAAAASAVSALASQVAAAASAAAALVSETNAAASAASIAFTDLGLAIGRSVGDDSIAPGAKSQGSVAIPAATSYVYTDVIAADSGLTLPATVASRNGYSVTVVANPSSTARLFVYPPLGAAFMGLADNVPVPLAPGQVLTCVQRSFSPAGWSYTVSDFENEEMFFRLTADRVGVNGTGTQDILGVGAVLEAGATYEYAMGYNMEKAAGATSHNLSLGFGGTAAFAANAGHRSLNVRLTAGVDVVGMVTNSIPDVILITAGIANASVTFRVSERGLFRCNGAGTFIPRYQLSAAPGGAYTVKAGAWMSIRKLLTEDIDRKGIWV